LLREVTGVEPVIPHTNHTNTSSARQAPSGSRSVAAKKAKRVASGAVLVSPFIGARGEAVTSLSFTAQRERKQKVGPRASRTEGVGVPPLGSLRDPPSTRGYAPPAMAS
jgi:hypothetical protein